ncbi:transcription factor E2F7 [Hypomesus transpacificus]|uniref:transcription factor E2F7 n=1 Tax=Hypomesus transpacificus TaxID=137520 RepID=UPI001F083CB7|nr:transcription factor E2F7 [Hypomesus transpacificus]
MEVECLSLKDLLSPKHIKVDLDGTGGEHEHKENIRVERRRSTPLKSEPAAAMLLYGRRAPIPDLVHITPIKHPDRAHPAPEPWTPTANLKMLISAASPDIRDREMKKTLFRPIENERDKMAEPQVEEMEGEAEEPCQFDVVEDEVEEDGERKPSRKQKSLGLLCQKFLALYPDYPASSQEINISLDEVATSLGVERRRIYDIVNVLESLLIVGRMAKNWYVWNGRQRLASTLAELQALGRKQRYHLHMEHPREGRETSATTLSTENGGNSDCGYATASKRKDKSLRIMSQKFVMLFLVSSTQTVTLDVAAKILIEESQDTASHSKYKTKVRRLYDIANVLTSLDLIKKVHVREERGRKPAFKWIGPTHFKSSDGDCEPVAGVSPSHHADTRPAAPQGGRQPRMTRHASFNVASASSSARRRVNSAPSSPRRETTGLLSQPVDYSRKTASSGAVCRLQFGNTTDPQTTPGLRTPSPLLHSPPLAPLAVSLHPEGPFGPLPPAASLPPHHRLAYLTSLSQPSVVMLYGGPAPQEPSIPGGQRSPESLLGKRPRGEGERSAKKDKRREGRWSQEAGDSPLSSSRPPPRQAAEPRDTSSSWAPTDGEVGQHSPSQLGQPSHYLYVPHSAGLNFLLSSGQPPSSLALPPGSVPTMAYLLVPSTLPQYPVMAGSLQGPDGHASFSVPAMVSPAHFMVGAGHYAVPGAPECGGSAPSPASPEQRRGYGPAAGHPHSPLETRKAVSTPLTEPLSPQTPKEAVARGSFFQTPGTLGNVVMAPGGRRRASAQRRLDIGHQPAN